MEFWWKMYWVGQKVCSGFSVLAYGKTKKNFLANPVISNSISTRPPNSKGVEASSLQTQESSPWCVSKQWERHGNSLQYSRLENPVDRGAWQATPVRGVPKSRTQLGNLTLSLTFTYFLEPGHKMVLTGITTVVNKGAYWLKLFYGSGGSLGEVFYFGIKWLKWYNFDL